MFYVRQNATHKVVIGPVVAVGDGFTPVTTLSLASADEKCAILHDNGTVVSISGYTFAAITSADGYYHLTLQSGISGTVGHVTIVINDDSLCLPVKADFTVVEEAVYDMLFAASAIGYIANQPVDVNTIKTQSVTCAAGVTVYPAVGTTATVKSNHEIVYSTDFATNYDTTSDMWKVKLGDVAHGGTAGVLTLSRIIVASATTNEPAVKLTGNGVGGAIVATGGATGPGAEFIGGASGGNGMSIYSQASDRGLYIQGSGSAGGVYIEGGGTGPGMYITGNTYGLEVHGGATNGTGIYATGGTATGYGIYAEAGSHAMYLHTTDGGDGIKFLGSVGGVFNTEINTIDDLLDTEVAAIKAKTDNLPASFPTNFASLAITAGGIVQADLQTIKTQTVTCSGGVTIPASTLASTTNITTAAGCAVSSIGSGVITATSIAADAIGASELAADAVAEIADAVWDELLSGHAISGSAGAGLSAAGSAGDPWSTALPGAYSAGTAGYILGTNLDGTVSSRASQTSLNTLDDYVDTEVAAIKNVTDAIGATGTGLTAIPWNASWDAEVQSECTDALQATIPDSIPADGTIPSVQQALYMLVQLLTDSSISGTTWTVKKVNGSTTLFTITLNDGTTPTGITRAT